MLTDDEIDGFADRAFKDYMQDKNDDYDRALARAVEAATLATVTPLVQEMADALDGLAHGYACAVRSGGTRCDCFKKNLTTKARAFLSGATKERERMEAALQSPRISIPPSMSPEEVRAWIEKHAQPAQAGADRAGG